MEFCGPYIFWNITSSALPHLSMYKSFGLWMHDDVLHHRISGVGHHSGSALTAIGNHHSRALMNSRHWPENVYSRGAYPATRFPSMHSEGVSLLQSIWLNRAMDTCRIRIEKRVREEPSISQEYRTVIPVTKKAMETAWKLKKAKEPPLDRPIEDNVVAGDLSTATALSQSNKTSDVASTSTVSYREEEEIDFYFPIQDRCRSIRHVCSRRSDSPSKASFTTVGCAGLRLDPHKIIFTNRDQDSDADVQSFHHTFEDAEFSLSDPSALRSIHDHNEDILAQQDAAASSSGASAFAESSSQEERGEQIVPSKSRRHPSIIRLLSLSESKLGRLTRRRKLSPSSEADGTSAPPPPSKRRRTVSGNLLVRSMSKVHERIRAVTLN